MKHGFYVRGQLEQTTEVYRELLKEKKTNTQQSKIGKFF